MTSNFSNRLKQALKENKMKQVNVIEKSKSYEKDLGVKISKTDISQYVNGKVNPGQNKLYILAKILNVSEAWLLGYDVEKERVSDTTRNIANQQDTIAAHFNKEDLTEEEMEEVEQFIEFVKNRRK